MEGVRPTHTRADYERFKLRFLAIALSVGSLLAGIDVGCKGARIVDGPQIPLAAAAATAKAAGTQGALDALDACQDGTGALAATPTPAP